MNSYFNRSWSQRGGLVYIVLTQTNPLVDLKNLAVKVTETACLLQIPGVFMQEWNLFHEIDQQNSQRTDTTDKIILVLPKKEPDVVWTSLERQKTESTLKDEASAPIHNSEKRERQALPEMTSSLVDSSSPTQKLANITMATGTVVTNGMLKGGNRSVGGAESLQDNRSHAIPETDVKSSVCHCLSHVKHDWYEGSCESLVVTLYVSQLDPWGVWILYQEDEFIVTFKTGDEKFHASNNTAADTTFKWIVKLFGAIVPDECHHRVSAKTLVVTLKKKSAGKWKSLFCSTDAVLTNDSQRSSGEWVKVQGSQTPTDTKAAAQPTTSKLNQSKKNGGTPFRQQRAIGFTGLSNLGNTCFINSVVQALANTAELKEYFLGNFYEKDINTVNPLGMKGDMARMFYCIIKKLWGDEESYFSPSKFRQLVGRRAAQFTDYMQHDAQEFMVFLLDILHEDMNKVKKKPYSQTNDNIVGDDHEMATESWKLHRSRNDSFIVDLFHGMFKSTLDCHECGKNSVKFDPFLFLPVPLPKAKRPITVFFHHKDAGKIPVKITLHVPQSGGKISELLASLARDMKCNPLTLTMFEVHKNRIHRFFLPTASACDIRSKDVIFVQESLTAKVAGESVYELAVMQRRSIPDVPSVCVHCRNVPPDGRIKRCLKCLKVGYCDHECQKNDWPEHRKTCVKTNEPVGMPFLASIPASKATYRNLVHLLLHHAKRSVTVRFLKHDNCGKEADADQETLDFVQSGFPFSLTPINWKGEVNSVLPPITDAGDDVLDLRKYKLVAMDWQTDNRQSPFVQVATADTAYKVDPLAASSLHHESTDLASCMHLFTEPEILADEEAWYCPRCKAHRNATKRMMVWQLPDVLILQLKRFSFKNFIWRDKIDTFVDFPIRGLDMSGFCVNANSSSPQLYDLFAVVNHHGGIFGGHYTSYVRLPKLNNSTEDEVGWRLCDDGHVRKVSSEEQVVSKAAYVIMYRKRKIELGFPEVPLTSQQMPTCQDDAITDTDVQTTQESPGTITPPLQVTGDPQGPLSNQSHSPSSNGSRYEEARENVDDGMSQDSDSEPYFLTACFANYDEEKTVDEVTGEPLIKYTELFDHSGKLLSDDISNDKTPSDLPNSKPTCNNDDAASCHNVDQARGDCKDAELMECAASVDSSSERATTVTIKSTDSMELPYTDMDAVD